MTAEPVTVPVSAGLEARDARRWNTHAIHHLPVVDGERPVGMLGYRQAVGRAARPASASASEARLRKTRSDLCGDLRSGLRAGQGTGARAGVHSTDSTNRSKETNAMESYTAPPRHHGV